MRSMIIIFILLFARQSIVAQMPTGFKSSTKIYLVRHAEKEAGKDPVLTNGGRQRAQDLYIVLKNKHIATIYTTPYKRTQMTGDSLRIKMAIDTVIYAADTTGADLIQKIIDHKDAGKTILVIGHSNTVPALIRHLGIADFDLKELPESAFDNLFLLTYKKKKPAVKKMQYGLIAAIPGLIR